MKKYLLSLILLITLGFSGANAVTLSTFGATADASGSSWTYTPGTSTLSGSEGLGDNLFGSTANTNLTGLTILSLTATATTAPTGAFTITLEDVGSKIATASFLWSNFTGGPVTKTSSLSFIQSGFNFANVQAWSLDSGGSTQTLNVSFSNLSAIPEPSSFLLLGMGGIAGCVVLARRKRAA